MSARSLTRRVAGLARRQADAADRRGADATLAHAGHVRRAAFLMMVPDDLRLAVGVALSAPGGDESLRAWAAAPFAPWAAPPAGYTFPRELVAWVLHPPRAWFPGHTCERCGRYVPLPVTWRNDPAMSRRCCGVSFAAFVSRLGNLSPTHANGVVVEKMRCKPYHTHRIEPIPHPQSIRTMSKPANRGRLLVVDDEVQLMRALCVSLTEQGFETSGLSDPTAAPDAVRGREFDLVLTDLMMPGTDGIRLLRQVLQIDPNLVCIIMTGQGTVHTAVEAMKTGAFDYMLKPFRIQQFIPVLDRAMDVRRLRTENVRLRRLIGQLTFESPRYQIIGSSAAVRKVIQTIEKVAPTEATALIRGPSGTGKELVARALHGNSPRRDKPLVTINCATLQEGLLESELFGHEKGSFTGADRIKAGLFEMAEAGTLFVDEVAEMAPALQAKFLRVLEDGHYRRVGSTQERYADVRVVAATNKVLEEEVKAGRFREDLFFRLNVITLTLPALRERREDVPALVDHFLRTRPLGRTPFAIDPTALAVLCGYDWPGNVRELANVIERAQILAEGSTLTVDDLPENLTQLSKPVAPVGQPPAPAPEASPDDLDGMECRHVEDVLRRHGGNKVQAAKALGVSRRTLYRLLEKHRPDGAGCDGAPEPEAG